MSAEAFDVSWKEPTTAQMAALTYVFDCAGRQLPKLPEGLTWQFLAQQAAEYKAFAADHDQPYSLTEIDLAEAILLAQDSLWFTQARNWVEDKTPVEAHAPLKELFQKGAQAICDIVRLGYQDGEWWNTSKLWPDPSLRVKQLCLILSLCYLIHEVRGQSGMVISAVFELLPELMVPRMNKAHAFDLIGKRQIDILGMEVRATFDKEWARQLNTAKRHVLARVSETYAPAKCVQPECEHQVAPPRVKPRPGHYRQYGRSGACCKAHVTYACTKPECQFRAQRSGYAEARHGFTTKVGQDHLKWRKADA